jgi:hypothetical protein
MLEIPMIQSAAKVTDATSRTAGKLGDDNRGRDTPADGFEAEYAAEREQRTDTAPSAASERAASEAKGQSGDADAKNQSGKSSETRDAGPSTEDANVEDIGTFDSATLTDGQLADPSKAADIALSATRADGTAVAAVGTPSDDADMQPVRSTADPKVTQEKAAGARKMPDAATAQTMASESQKPFTARNSTAETVITSKAAVLSKSEAAHAAPAASERTTSQPEKAANPANPIAAQAMSMGSTPPGRPGPASRDHDLTKAGLRRDQPPQPSPPTAMAPAAKPTFFGSQDAVQMKLTAQKDKVDLSPVVPGDLDVVTAWEPRAGTTNATGSLAQTLARADTPAAIGRQMAEALQKLPDRPVEVSLNPRELGRVRMSIAASEAGITVSVVVERPETLDLMRRNIDQLAREFQSIGYENINFSFAEGHSRDNRQTETGFDDHAAGTAIELEHIESIAAVPGTHDTITTGLDLRL